MPPRFTNKKSNRNQVWTCFHSFLLYLVIASAVAFKQALTQTNMGPLLLRNDYFYNIKKEQTIYGNRRDH